MNRTLPIVVALGCAVASTGCGGGSEKPSCQTDGHAATAIAAEQALIERGRADADFGHAFGSDSRRLLDAADAQRHALLEQVAAAHGLVLPIGGATTDGCSSSNATVRTGAILALTARAFALAADVLALAVESVPANGMTKDSPFIQSESGSAADGTQTQTTTTIDTSFGSHDSTAVVMLTISSSIMAGSTWTTESVAITATVNVCPDAGGVAPGTFDLIGDGAVGSGSSAGSSYHAEINDTFAFVVNDAAQVASEIDASSFTYRAMGTRDAHAAAHQMTTLAGGAPGETTVVVDESDGSDETAQLVQLCLYPFGQYTAALVKDGAESKWRGGTCVGIRTQPMPDGTGKVAMIVDPNAQIGITAQPYQKFEMSDLGAPVVATLVGPHSLTSANQSTPPPAMFSYVAGSNYKDQGIVTLKSTSKRGIGTQDATFTVRCDDKKMCPGMQTLNLETCACACPPPAPKTCLGSQTLDPQTCLCACRLQCAPGQTLNTSLCECETSCAIDPTTGSWPTDCTWVGTVRVMANESGHYDDTTSPIIQDHETWSLSYDASLSAALPATTSGTVTGTWHQVGTTVWPTAPCTQTITTDVSASNSVTMGVLGVVPMGRGMVSLYVDFGTAVYGMGTTTDDEGCGSGTTQVTPGLADLAPSAFVEAKTASGSTFSGTDPDAAPMYLVFADGSHARFNLTWDLRLVRR